MPTEVEAHTVPHFKASVNGKVELWWLECASTLSIQTSLLKIDHLLDKSSFVETQSFITVIGKNFSLSHRDCQNTAKNENSCNRVCCIIYIAPYSN